MKSCSDDDDVADVAIYDVLSVAIVIVVVVVYAATKTVAELMVNT